MLRVPVPVVESKSQLESDASPELQTKEAIVALDVFGDRSSDLVSIAKYLLERTY